MEVLALNLKVLPCISSTAASYSARGYADFACQAAAGFSFRGLFTHPFSLGVRKNSTVMSLAFVKPDYLPNGGMPPNPARCNGTDKRRGNPIHYCQHASFLTRSTGFTYFTYLRFRKLAELHLGTAWSVSVVALRLVLKPAFLVGIRCIVFARAQEQVVRIAARGVITAMANLHSHWNSRSTRQFKGLDMSPDCPAFEGHRAIPTSTKINGRPAFFGTFNGHQVCPKVRPVISIPSFRSHSQESILLRNDVKEAA